MQMKMDDCLSMKLVKKADLITVDRLWGKRRFFRDYFIQLGLSVKNGLAGKPLALPKFSRSS